MRLIDELFQKEKRLRSIQRYGSAVIFMLGDGQEMMVYLPLRKKVYYMSLDDNTLDPEEMFLPKKKEIGKDGKEKIPVNKSDVAQLARTRRFEEGIRCTVVEGIARSRWDDVKNHIGSFTPIKFLINL